MYVLPFTDVYSYVESPRSSASCKDFAGGSGVIMMAFVWFCVVRPPFGENCDALKSFPKVTFLLIS